MTFDVTIVGAGLVGTALARALHASGLACALVDMAAPAEPDDAWDSRVYAIAPANQAFLESLGAWTEIETRIAPVRLMKVFGDHGARLEFSAYECGVDRLASIVESGRVQSALWRGLQNDTHVTLFCPARPAALRHDGAAMELTLEGGTQLRTRLLVGADGARSWVREAAGIRSSVKPTGHTAVVANFACAEPHQEVAFQWFRRDGVLAWLPLAGNRLSMVWSTSATHAETLLGLSPEALCEHVAQAGAHALGALELITPPASFPLTRLSVPHRVRPRLALIGDASHVIHPLAGQGVNLGLADAQGLARLLQHRPSQGPRADPGDLLLLREFERSRAEDILAMRLATDGLQRLFAAQWPGLAQVRSLGLNLTDRLPVVKNLLARRAMGPVTGMLRDHA